MSLSRSSKRAGNKILHTMEQHPIGTAAVAAGAVAGALVLRKAVNTAAKVATIAAAGGAAKKVADAVTSRRAGKGRRATTTAKPRTKKARR